MISTITMTTSSVGTAAISTRHQASTSPIEPSDCPRETAMSDSETTTIPIPAHSIE